MNLFEFMDINNIRYDSTDTGIYVPEWLNLTGSPVTSLPDSLEVDGGLYIRGTAIPMCTTNKAGVYYRIIYAFLLGDPDSPDNRPNRVRVTAGCFYGTLEEFNKAVDKRYAHSQEEAEKYKDKMAGIVERAVKGDWD